MAESVRELVVTLSMSAGNFAKTCTDINNQIKGVQAEFNAITGGIDGWQSTIEGRKVKLDALNGTLDLQQQKVAFIAEELRKANAALAADPGNLSKARKVSSLETQLNNAKAAAELTKAEIEKLNAIQLTRAANTLKSFGRNLKSFGRQFSIYVGGPLAALGITSFNAFKDYEMSAAMLEGKLDGPKEEVDALVDAALRMSETIPVGFEELMAIMTSFAAAGVPAENIEKMTLVMSQLSAVTGMSVDEVSTDMIKFMNAFGLPLDNVDQLASALVMLADTSIATEADIFSMATKMAATGGLAGFDPTEVLAFAAAFSSMGIEAEAGGTAINKLMKKFQLAAETGEGIDDLSAVVGATSEEFSNMWSNDPSKLMVSFFDGLSNGGAEGNQSVLALLDTLGLTEARLSNLVAVGASNPDMFTKLLGVGEQGFEENVALLEKAGLIFDTVSGQMDVIQNTMRNTQADLGENVAETFGPIIEKVGELVSEFGKLDEATQTNWVLVSGALVGLGPVASFIGTVSSGVGKIIGSIAKIKSSDVENLSGVTGALSKLFSSPLGTVLGVGGVIAGVGLLLNSMYNESTAIRESLSGIVVSLDDTTYNAAMDSLRDLKAQSDALSGKQGEYNKNVSAAVKAGYGTSDMYGTALGYEAALTQKAISDIAGKYASQIDELNSAIGAETDKAKQASLAAQRDALQAKWDAETQATRASYTEAVSALVSGMMQAQPEAKAALEQAAKDYDLLAIIGDIEAEALAQDSGAGMIEVYKKLFTPENMDRFFQGKSFEDLIGMDPGKASMYAAQIQENLKRSMVDALQKNEDSGGLAFTLWQTILGDPMTAGMFDQTKTTGALDGIIEALDYKTAGETAGKGWADALTTGLADSITSGTTGLVVPAATTMAESLDQAVTGPLGIQSPSTVMMAHGLDVATGLHLGIIQGIPLVSGAMSVLGAAITAIAAAQGAAAGAAYGRAFGNNASIQFSAAVAKIKREIDEMNIRIIRGYGGTP